MNMSTTTTKSNAVNEALQLPLHARFEADLTALLSEVNKTDAPCLTLALLDLDNCLELNKNLGGEAVDDMMIRLLGHFKRGLPENCSMYRFSGDCFTVIMPGRDKEDAFLLIERLRAEANICAADGTPITLSAGIATAPEDGSMYFEFVRKADGAALRAKQQGKNRVCLAREEKMVTKTSHYTPQQLQKLTELSKNLGAGEAVLLREALDLLLQKYDRRLGANF
jgi:diguanylate cyclase (GGDEF)-like protein